MSRSSCMAGDMVRVSVAEWSVGRFRDRNGGRSQGERRKARTWLDQIDWQERRQTQGKPARRAGRRRRLCRPGRRRVDQAGAAEPVGRRRRRRARRRLADGRPRLGDRRRRLPHARAARLLGRDRAASAGDHRDDRHRFAHLRSGAAGVPDLRRRGRAGRAVRPYGRQQGCSTARCAGARPSSASTSSRASPSRRFDGEPGGRDGASCRRRDACRRALLVAADGVKSRLRDMAGIKTVDLGIWPVRHRLHGGA